MKRALVFIDGDAVKIVLGSIMKVVRIDELTQPHNLAFFDRMFSESQVLVVESVSPMDKNAFVELIRSHSNETPRSDEPAQEVHHQSRLPATRVQEPLSPIIEEVDGNFLKSIAKMTIIIDDLPLGHEFAPGCPECLSIPPGGSVNLSMIDQDSVRKSKILQKLIANGTLIPITGIEADRLNEDIASRNREDADARLQASSPILDMRVEDYVSGMGRGGGPGRDAVPIDLDEDIYSHQYAKNKNRPQQVSEEVDDVQYDSGGFKSMSELLNAREAIQSEPESPRTKAEPQEQPRRQLAQRPQVAVTGAVAKGIAKKHKATT